jgi:hypothetical protein
VNTCFITSTAGTRFGRIIVKDKNKKIGCYLKDIVGE